MSRNLTAKIEKWFDRHAGDGNFALECRSHSYSVIGPVNSNTRIVYATKPRHVVMAIDASATPDRFGMIGRYGLPQRADVKWIRDFVGNRKVLFLGDLDPPDLIVYAYLRAHFAPVPLRHLGINDAFLKKQQSQLPEGFLMSLSKSERRSVPFLREVLPDLAKIVGRHCAQLLEDGRKIELEAVSSANLFAGLLNPAIKL